jgi:hypothetical protein
MLQSLRRNPGMASHSISAYTATSVLSHESRHSKNGSIFNQFTQHVSGTTWFLSPLRSEIKKIPQGGDTALAKIDKNKYIVQKYSSGIYRLFLNVKRATQTIELDVVIIKLGTMRQPKFDHLKSLTPGF